MKATDINLEALLTDSEETDYQFMIKFFKPEQVLGLGAFSIVIKAYDILSRKNVAIKILEKSLHNSMCMEILKKEAEILDQLNHPNIPRFYMERESRTKIYLVQELLQGRTLEAEITERAKESIYFKEDEIISIIKQIVSALQYIQKKNIIHRDLKPENVMIMYDENKDIKVKLIDFGLSAQLQNQNHSLFLKNCGTLLFMAPELVQKKAYNWSVDIWALGLIVYCLFTLGQHPLWTDHEDNKQSFKQKLELQEPWQNWPTSIGEQKIISHHIFFFNRNAKSFIQRTANYRPDSRMTPDQCAMHPWLQGKNTNTDFITLGDMITAFTNKQNFFKVLKGLIALEIFKNKSENCEITKFLYEDPKQEFQKPTKASISRSNSSEFSYEKYNFESKQKMINDQNLDVFPQKKKNLFQLSKNRLSYRNININGNGQQSGNVQPKRRLLNRQSTIQIQKTTNLNGPENSSNGDQKNLIYINNKTLTSDSRNNSQDFDGLVTNDMKFNSPQVPTALRKSVQFEQVTKTDPKQSKYYHTDGKRMFKCQSQQFQFIKEDNEQKESDDLFKNLQKDLIQESTQNSFNRKSNSKQEIKLPSIISKSPKVKLMYQKKGKRFSTQDEF